AKNHCLMKLRGGQSKNLQELTEGLVNVPVEDQKTELIENERTYTLLEEAIEELNEEQKQCVTLFYIHKYSYNQIVEKTNFSLSQVKSYLQNGKRNLKLLLEKKLKENQTKQ
ncbi:MAG TPA: sigma factor-like helix-turn-helix DNA-binding protein, partial [Flavisolibacter sp.]|nr:sigma factor-like helix-turn-helix DNA-binding protein [Flavisolibacter sp.]